MTVMLITTHRLTTRTYKNFYVLNRLNPLEPINFRTWDSFCEAIRLSSRPLNDRVSDKAFRET